MVSSVLALTVTRGIPSTAQSNSQFSVTYSVDSEGAENFGLLISDDISGGCTTGGMDKLRIGYFPGDDSKTAIFDTLSGGTCTFSGNYVFTLDGSTSNKVNFPTATVNVDGDCTPNSCSQMGWDCGSGAESSCGDTISCGDCSSGFHCSSKQCVEDSTTPDCITSSDCPGSQFCSNQNCVDSGTTTTTTDFCPDGDEKQFWQNDECDGLSGLAWGGIIIIGLFIGFSLLKKWTNWY